MSSSLIIIGKELIFNKPYMRYVMEELEKHITIFDSIKILNKNDNDFFIKLEVEISEYDQTVILSNHSSFAFVSKILSTIMDDHLELRDDMLMPSKTLLYSKNSYVINKNEKSINVLSIEENRKLPEILIDENIESKTFTVINIDIDSIKILLEPICANYDIKITTTSIIDGWVKINSKAYKYGNLENFLKAIKSLFVGKFIENQNIIEHIALRLEANNKKITAVESCTGGLISTMLTKQPGISNVFDGAIVSYANKIKESWIGVNADTLENYGAVSENCVSEMLSGILAASNADFALATSGIAGPSGGDKAKPVGTVFVGVKSKNQDMSIVRLLLEGDRHYIQTQSAYYAFKLLLQLDKKLFF